MCGKVLYESSKHAAIALKKINQRRKHTTKIESTSYYCRKCKAFHLTTQRPQK